MVARVCVLVCFYRINQRSYLRPTQTQTRFTRQSRIGIYGNPQNTLRAWQRGHLSLSMPHIPSDRAPRRAPPLPPTLPAPRRSKPETCTLRTHAARRLSDRERAASSAASPPHHTRLRGRVGIRGSRGEDGREASSAWRVWQVGAGTKRRKGVESGWPPSAAEAREEATAAAGAWRGRRSGLAGRR